MKKSQMVEENNCGNELQGNDDDDEGMGKDVVKTSESSKGARDAGTSLKVDRATSVAVEQTGLPEATDEGEFLDGAGENVGGPEGVEGPEDVKLGLK